MCFGDAILLNYTQKVFTEDISKQKTLEDPEFQEGGSADEDGKVAEEEIKGQRNDEKLTRVIADPQYVYKGMVYSDGILDQHLKVIPKNPQADTFNAKC